MILCKLFKHKWDYSHSDKICSTGRVCKRCNQEEHRNNLKEKWKIFKVGN